MNGMKLLGQKPMAQDVDRQTAELQLRIAILSRFIALGIPVTEPVVQAARGKGALSLQAFRATEPLQSHQVGTTPRRDNSGSNIARGRAPCQCDPWTGTG